MGLFFNKKRKKESTQVDDARVYLSSEANKIPDMNALVKNEQKNQEIENPFVESAPTMAQKSVAKRYGDKYIGVAGKQIASSIVVDVRSYKKPAPPNKISEILDDDDDIDEPTDRKTSFFDEIMRQLDEDDDNPLDLLDEKEDDAPPVVEEKKTKAKPEKGKKSSSKRKIDIDIISGDFGGADVI